MTPKEIIEKAKQGITDKKEKELNNKQISGFVADILKPYLENIQPLPPSETVTPNDENVLEAKVIVDMSKIKIPDVNIPEIEIDTKDIEKAIIKSMSEIKVPEIKMPEIKIDTKDIEKAIIKSMSKIKMPEAKESKIPDIDTKGIEKAIKDAFSKIEIPEIKMPEGTQRIILVDPNTGNDYKAQMSMSSSGGGVVSMRPLVEVPAGYEQLTVSSTAIPFASIPDKAGKVVISVEDDSIRYRDDGTDPTTTVGMVAYPGTVIILNSKQAITKFKAIRITTDAELNCLYYAINE